MPLIQYDPLIGRWYNPDPYMQHHSPYLAMSNNPVSFTDPDGGWDGDNGFNDNPFGAGLYANSTSVNNPDAYGKSEFDRQYNPSGSWGGSIGADGSFTSNESWIAGAHANWKKSQESKDYFETNVHFDKDGGLVDFSDAMIVGYRSDMMYDYISKKGKQREAGFLAKLDRAIGEGLFGKAGYGAVKKNASDNNPYMFTNEELNEAAMYELEALSYFIPVGEVFQGVKWAGRGLKLLAKGLKSKKTLNLAAKGGVNIASSAGGKTLPMTIEKILPQGSKIADIVNDVKGMTWMTGNEHAVVRLANGQKAIVSGGPGGISFQSGQIRTLFGHTHPTSAPASLSDYNALRILGQSRQYVIHGGQTTLIRP